MANLQQVPAQMQRIWSGWTIAQRVFIAAATLTAPLLMVGLIVWASQPVMAPLLTQLTETDVSEISAKLAAMNVAYEISSAGTAVMVPSERVHELRMALAADGLPQGGGVGFEIFDEADFGRSRFAEQLNYRRALEGELRRTIRTIDGVSDARVHIVVPERSLFRGEEQKSRAAVNVQLARGRQLSDGQVNAISHLVASSVPGLDPGAVTIVDNKGRVLARGDGDAMDAAGSQLEFQEKFERSMEERVRQILERIVGIGKVSVRVAAAVDQKQVELTTESYDPESQVVRSEQVSHEQKGSGAAQEPAGVPGARSNVGRGQRGKTPEGAAADRRVETRNYEFNKQVRREVAPRGSIVRLSVAVLVDGREETDDTGKAVTVDRSPEELARLSDLVKTAVGYDAQRGDQIEVQSAAFVEDIIEDVPAPSMWLKYLRALWRPLAALLAVAFVGLALMRRASLQQPSIRAMLDQPRTVREIETVMNAPDRLRGPGADHAEHKDPERVTAVIKDWLAEA